MSSGLMFPKPIPRERKRPGWKKKPARRLSRPGSDPGRLEFARSLPCVGIAFIPHHICVGATEASHLRHHTGLGLKAKDRDAVPKCSLLHLAWERHVGPFKDWSNEQRHAWMIDRIHETNRQWDALTDAQRDDWQGLAELDRRRRAEAHRGMP